MSTYPDALDPVRAFTRADGSTAEHSDDHGQVIDAWFNVKAYGAAGDGTTDDSVAIRTAVEALTASTAKGKTLYFPRGRYKTTLAGRDFPLGGLGDWFNQVGCIAVLPSDCRVTGPGTIYMTGVPAVGDVAPHTGQYTVFAIIEDTENIVIDGLTFEGENDPFTYVQNSHAAGVFLYADGEVNNVTVQNCTFKNFYGFTFHAVATTYRHINAINNTSLNCANGLNVNSDYSTQSGNRFYNSEGIEASGAFLSCTNNVFEASQGVAISIGGDTSGALIRGVCVQGNTINGSTGVGLVLGDGIQGAAIVGNTITRCETAAISMSSSTGYPPSHNLFTGNNIFGNCEQPGANVTAVVLGGGGYHSFVGNRVWDDDVAGWYQQIGVLCGVSGTYVADNHIFASDAGSKCIEVSASITAYIGENYYHGDGRRVTYGASAVPETQQRWFATATDQVVDYRTTGGSLGATFSRYTQYANGKMEWGDASNARDVSIERSAANVLALGANDAIKTGAAAHGSLPAATGYAAGSQFYCTTDKQPLWSDGTVWVEADGTNH